MSGQGDEVSGAIDSGGRSAESSPSDPGEPVNGDPQWDPTHEPHCPSLRHVCVPASAHLPGGQLQQPRLAPGVHTGGGGGGGIAPNAAPIAVWPAATVMKNVQEVLVPHELAAPVQPEN